MMDYVSYTDFTPVDLENDGGKIEEFDQDES